MFNTIVALATRYSVRLFITALLVFTVFIWLSLMTSWVILLIPIGFSIYVSYIILDSMNAYPSETTLSNDLKRLDKIIKLTTILNQPININEVSHYYESTTLRDYRFLEFFMGPGMHTYLTANEPIGRGTGSLRQASLILKEIIALQPTHVLELGCGKGINTFFLASMNENIQFEATDLLPLHIDIANAHLANNLFNNVVFCQANFQSNQFNLATQHQSFDLIFGIESLCYLDTHGKRAHFFRQIKSMLKPRGKIIIIDGFRSPHFEQASQQEKLAMQLAEKGFRIDQSTTSEEWINQAAQANFACIKQQDLSEEAFDFWLLSWHMARFLSRFPWLWTWYMNQSPNNQETGASLISLLMIAHTLCNQRTASYEMLAFENNN